MHSVPFMYALKGKALTSDGSGGLDQASARGLKADLDYVEKILSENKGTLQGTEAVGPADVSMRRRGTSVIRH